MIFILLTVRVTYTNKRYINIFVLKLEGGGELVLETKVVV
jgi:hypothetical protein